MSAPYLKAQAQQRFAADPRANVFVTANAGSGKTKVLIDRIARLLLDGARPASCLCITYTKAAAAEMQRRLFRQLGDWCVAEDKALRAALEDLRGPGAKVADEELPRARALFAQALETPGGLKIQTIHAFCERLLARFPLEADAPPGFDVADEARGAELIRRAQSDVLEGEDARTLAAFAHFATRLGGDDLDDLLRKLADRLRDETFDEAALRARHGDPGAVDEILADALSATPWRDLLAAADQLAASTKQDQDRAAGLRDAHAMRERPHECWRLYLDVYFTLKGEPRAKLVTAKFAANAPSVARLLEDELGRVQAAAALLKAAERTRDAVFAHALADALAKAYKREKARAGVLDFPDLIFYARRLLTRAQAAPWVLYKLDGGIDHILIDEGQDTSPAQWDLIAPLQEEFFAGASDRVRTVFAVGDPKQSIYSFQGAKPARFLGESQSLERRTQAASATFVAPTLEMSFRSAPEILKAVDATFDDIDLALGEPESFNVLRHEARRADEPGVVEIWPITPRPQARETRAWDAPLDQELGARAEANLAREIAQRVKAWIASGESVWEKGVRRPMRAGDVLALVRKRGAMFQSLIKAFKREGLAVAGADRMTLRDELAVEDCMALMRVALDPSDDLSLACVLKGPWLDLTDDDHDLFPLAYERGGATLLTRLLDSQEARLAPAQAFVRALTARGGDDPFAFLSWALETPHGGGETGRARVLARLGAEARDPLDELLERALKPPRREAATLQRFLADLEADAAQVKREMESGDDAIRVMTVHGAKGLEAPVVILLDTTAGVSARSENGLIHGEDGLFYSPSAKEDDEVTAQARANFAAAAAGEHWRLLYVAMTRARDHLLICGFGLGRDEGKAAADSWHTRAWEALSKIAAPVETPFGDGLRLGVPEKAAARVADERAEIAAPAWAMRALLSQVTRRVAPSRLKEPSPLSPRRNDAQRFERGRHIHGLLERLPDVAPGRRRDAGLAWLARRKVEPDEAEALLREALNVIEGAAFADAFGPNSRAEAPIVGAVEGRSVRGVIDRLVIGQTDVLVLDYKSDRPAPAAPEDAPGAYVLQMALYRAVLAQIFPERRIRCALVWTEKPVLTELSAGQMEDALARFGRG